jgi:hypothetical protein
MPEKPAWQAAAVHTPPPWQEWVMRVASWPSLPAVWWVWQQLLRLGLSVLGGVMALQLLWVTECTALNISF